MTRQHSAAFRWSLAVFAALLFAWLGHWQLQRMQQKQLLLERAAQVRDHPVTLLQGLRADRPPAWVSGAVELVPTLVLLDNQTRDGRAGVRVYQPARVDGAGTEVLVDLGWLPLPADRQLPRLQPLQGRQLLRGLLVAPPSAGIALGPAMQWQAAARCWLATRIEPKTVSKALGGRDISSQVLRLDPALPLGYPRDLDMLPNTLPPARHLAYAVQWFGLALAVLTTAGLLQWRAHAGRHGR